MKSKLVIFLVRGKQVEEIDGDVEIGVVESIKTNLAIIHHVSYDEIEIDTKDVEVREFSHFMISEFGLQCVWDTDTNQTRDTVAPPFINNPRGLDNFLDLLFKGDIDNAIGIF